MRGAPARMNRIMEIARRRGIAVIEDVAQAMGGRFRGQRLGTLGDAGCFSMQTYKLMCVGEGGAVVARDPQVFDRIRAFHGEAGSSSALLSLNYGMSELSAAVGCVQLERLEHMIARMRAIKARLLECLLTVAARRPLMIRAEADADGDSATCVTWFEPTPAAAHRVCAALRAAGIGSSRGYRPGVPDLHVFRHWEAIMRQRPLAIGGGPWRHANRTITYSAGMCPHTIDLLSRAVEVAVLPQYRDRDVSRMVHAMRSVLMSVPDGEPDIGVSLPTAQRPSCSTANRAGAVPQLLDGAPGPSLAPPGWAF
jgi:8-amino-3,8-dideoxy-alpha-D-manno-octulosonate transaminase